MPMIAFQQHCNDGWKFALTLVSFLCRFFALVLAVTPPINTDCAATMAEVLVWYHTPQYPNDLLQDTWQALEILDDAIT